MKQMLADLEEHRILNLLQALLCVWDGCLLNQLHVCEYRSHLSTWDFACEVREGLRSLTS